MDRRKLFTYHLLFALAILLVTIGAGLLVVTTGMARGPSVARPLAVFVATAILTYVAVLARWRAKIVFLGLLAASIAAIRFVGEVLGLSAVDYWPLYAIAAGACIVPANLALRRRIKPSTVIVSSAFVFLGLFFSIFSFGFSSMSFRVFLGRWWPALFIASGLVLLLLWLLMRLVSKDQEQRSRHEVPPRER